MKKCIYTKKDESSATFTSAEHIFPRCIGGVNTLDKEWVCDEFNNEMSKCEQTFAREYPPISFSRAIFESEGRKSHHGQAGVSSLKSLETGQLTLGYIKGVASISIPQVAVEIPSWGGNLTGEMHGVITKPAEYEQLVKALANYEGRFQILRSTDETIKGKMLIGHIRKQVYLGVYEQIDDATAIDCAQRLKNFFQHIQSDATIKVVMKKDEHRVNYQKTVQFCVYDIMRVHAKIVFNVLAHLNGQAFVLRPEFNEITNAITTGKDISKYVSAPDAQFSMNVGARLFREDEHFVFLTRICNRLVGVVILYGSTPSFSVILSDHWTEPFEPCGYVCNWRKKEEYSLVDFLLQCNFLKSSHY